MPLKIGDDQAESGMTKVVYDAIDHVLGEKMEDSLPDDMPEEKRQEIMSSIRNSWKDIGHAIATAVVTYLRRDEPTDEPTEYEYAESFSSTSEDDVFWDWLNGFVNVFSEWTPEPNDGGDALKTALIEYFQTKSVPTELKGIIK